MTLCDEKKLSVPLLLAPTNCKDVRIRIEASRLTGTYQVFIFFIIDTRLLVCVADSLQESCFAGVSTTDDKNAKLTVFLPNFIVVAHVDGGSE